MNVSEQINNSKSKRQKTDSCVGIFYGQNTDLLPLYDKYKKKDSVNDSLYIACKFGKWSIHSLECTGEEVKK